MDQILLPPPPPQPQPYAEWRAVPPPPQGNGFAVTALVLGIVALVFGVIPFTFFIAIPCGVLAVIFGALALNRVTQGGTGKGQAVAGLVTGGVGILFALGWLVLLAVAANDVSNDFDEIGNNLEACDVYTGDAYYDCLIGE